MGCLFMKCFCSDPIVWTLKVTLKTCTLAHVVGGVCIWTALIPFVFPQSSTGTFSARKTATKEDKMSFAVV